MNKKLIATAVGLALAVLAVALVLFRVPLASHVLAIYLQKAGIPGQARVTTLGLGGATLEAEFLDSDCDPYPGNDPDKFVAASRNFDEAGNARCNRPPVAKEKKADKSDER